MKRKPASKTSPGKSCRALGIVFSDPVFLEAAFTHPSHRNENPSRPKLADFDRLEFFGDSVLNYVICQELIKIFPEANEGLLSRYRSTLVSRKILARVAGTLKLGKLLKLGQGLERENGPGKSKILADAFEAFLAVVHDDQGLEKTRKFILRHWRPYLDPRRIIRLDPNPKSSLQELSQKLWKKIPVYSWKPVAEGIQVCVQIGRRCTVKVTGENRRELEEKAARELLRKLRTSVP